MIEERPLQAVKGYELREQIGEGGYGVVYRAYQSQVGRNVAIKIILPQYAKHPEFIRRFRVRGPAGRAPQAPLYRAALRLLARAGPAPFW